MFSAQEDTLSFWQAERVLTEGRTPTKDEVAHLAISLKADAFQALGRDETSCQQALNEVAREAIAEIANELAAKELRGRQACISNNEHPHLRLLIKCCCDDTARSSDVQVISGQSRRSAKCSRLLEIFNFALRGNQTEK